MMREVNTHQRRRSSSIGRNSNGESGTLKQKMSNLLPSLDASVDSHFSSNEATVTTHASSTANHASFQTSFTGSTLHSDLGDSSEDEDLMAASIRSAVSHKLKKVFGKIKKSKTGSSSKIEKKKKKKARASVNSSVPRYFDDVSVDDESDEEDDEPVPEKRGRRGSSLFSSSSTFGRAAKKQPVSDSRRRGARDTSNNKSSRGSRSSDPENSDDCSNWSSDDARPQRRPKRSSTCSKSKERSRDGKSTSRQKSRASGGKSSGGGGGGVGKRLPPKSKSYDAKNKGTEKRPGVPSRSSSQKVTSSDRQRNAAAVRSSNVTAKEAIPNPRDRRQSTNRRPSKAISRSRSFKTTGSDERELSHPKGKSNSKPIRKSKSFNKSLVGTGENSGENVTVRRASSSRALQHLEKGGPTRAASQRRSISRSRDKKNPHPAMNSTASAAVCRHGEKLGECCYQYPKILESKTPALDAFIADPAVGRKTSDDMSIDTMDTEKIDTEMNKPNSNSMCQFYVAANPNPVNEAANARKQMRRRSISRSRSPSARRASRSRSPSARAMSRRNSRSKSPSASVCRRSISRSKSPTGRAGRSVSRQRKGGEITDRRRSISRVRNNSSERGRRSSVTGEAIQKRAPSKNQRGKQSNVEEKEKGPRSKSRGRRSSKDQTAERERSESRSTRGSVTQSKRGRSKSVHNRDGGLVDTAGESQQKFAPSKVRRPSVARSKSNTRKEAPRKQYETLSKKDLVLGDPDDADGAVNRRPRSLSRTRRTTGDSNGQKGQELLRQNQDARVSRSLSRTPGIKKLDQQRIGIGGYLDSKQPERKSEDDETNSQTTGTNTTGSCEVTYKTPSWMWTKGNPAPANQHPFQASISSSFNNSFQTAKSSFSQDHSSSFQDSFQTAASENTEVMGNLESVNSYDERYEISASDRSAFALGSLADNQGNESDNSFSTSTTSASKAKKFYGKAMEKERAEIRAQSQQLFQNVGSVVGGNR